MKWKHIAAITVLITGCKVSLECDVEVTRTTVDFGHCYNGLTIAELKVWDAGVDLYPRNFDKVRVYDLARRNTSEVIDVQNVQVNFFRKDDRFVWRYFKSVKGHKNDDAYVEELSELKDTLGNIFKPDTWYLLNFFNPHFRLFVYCDSTLALKSVKEKLNANF